MSKPVSLFLDRQAQSSDLWRGAAVYEHCLRNHEKTLQQADFLYTYGYKFLGMAYSVYLHWAIEKAEQLGIDRLLFMAREGYLFQKVYDIFAEHAQLAGTAQVETTYAYLSRVSTFLASAPQLTTREVVLGTDKPTQQGLWSILKTLGLPVEPFEPLAQAHGLEMRSPISNYWTDQKLARFLSDTQVQSLVRFYHQQAHQKLADYLQQCHFWGENQKVGLIDIGWHGTIQDNLVRAFNQRSDFPLTYGLYFGRRQQKTFLKYSGSFAYGLIYDDRDQRIHGESINSCAELFEKGAGAPHASTIGYEYTEAGRVRPIFKSAQQKSRQGELAADPAVAVMQQGALDFARHYAQRLAAEPFSAESMKPFLEGLMTRHISFPTHQEAMQVSQKLGQQAEDMGEDTVRRLAIAPHEFWRTAKKGQIKGAARLFTSAHWNAGSAKLLKIPGLQFLFLLKRFVFS